MLSDRFIILIDNKPLGIDFRQSWTKIQTVDDPNLVLWFESWLEASEYDAKHKINGIIRKVSFVLN